MQSKKGQGMIIGIIVVVLLVIGSFFLFGEDSSSTDSTTDSTTDASDNSDSLDAQDSPPVKEFVLTGENFKFVENGIDNPEMRVNVGDTVRITFTSTQGYHDWVIDEFSAATAKVSDGDANPTTTVEFVADRAGTFEYYCSVGSHRANGMKGNLIVE